MSQFCLSIKSSDFEYCRSVVSGIVQDMVEIRLDDCNWDDDQIKGIFSLERDVKLIASCVMQSVHGAPKAVEMLSAAILAGAEYVDIGTWIPEQSRKWLISLALNRGCQIIISYHNFSCTPTTEELKKIITAARAEGADIVKVVTTAENEDDCSRILELYDFCPKGTLEAFAMGEIGEESRLRAAAQYGAPFIYLAPSRKTRTAPGQFTLYDFWEREELPLEGVVDGLPASKSFAQRAIILASLCTGTTKLYKYTSCMDCEAAIGVARQFGAEITQEGSTLTIVGHQNIPENGLKIEGDTLFVGESALLARLCIPLVGLSDKPVTICGTGSLERRKICEYKTTLAKFGLKIESKGGYLPIKVSGKLHTNALAPINGAHGSQIISGLLIALSFCKNCGVPTMLHIDNITSRSYLDLTGTIMGYFGMEIPDYPEDEDEAPIRNYIIATGQNVRPVVGLECEADWSSAALMMCAAATMGNVDFKGLNINSWQPDATIYDLLEVQNNDIVRKDDGTINVRKGLTCPFDYDITDTPDLFGALIILALRCCGESCIRGLDRLHTKESDRAKTFLQEFKRIGADLFIAEDGNLYVEGSPYQMLKGGECSSHGDHRLAMALQVAGLICREGVQVDDLSCTLKSWPEFVKVLESITVKREPETTKK